MPVQLLPTGISPEGVVAIPHRGQVVAADEASGTLTIFQGGKGPALPSPDRPALFAPNPAAPFAALSGLAPMGAGNLLALLPDNALPTQIYLTTTGAPFAPVVSLALVRREGSRSATTGKAWSGTPRSWRPPPPTDDSNNWVGLSEIINIGKDQFAIIERDQGIGLGSLLEKVYAFSLKGLTPDKDGKPDSTDTVSKKLVLDILDEFFPYEKAEGLTLLDGDLWVGLDNDGGDVEPRLLNTGRFKNPLKPRGRR